jgi:hypothetical protein
MRPAVGADVRCSLDRAAYEWPTPLTEAAARAWPRTVCGAAQRRTVCPEQNRGECIGTDRWSAVKLKGADQIGFAERHTVPRCLLGAASGGSTGHVLIGVMAKKRVC